MGDGVGLETSPFRVQGKITLLNNAAYPRPQKQTPQGRQPLKGGVDPLTTEPLGELTLLDLNSTDKSFYPDVDNDFYRWNSSVVNLSRKLFTGVDFVDDPPTLEESGSFLENEQEFWTLLFFFPDSDILPFPVEGSALAQLKIDDPIGANLYLVSFAYFRAFFIERAQEIEERIGLKRKMLQKNYETAQEDRDRLQREIEELDNLIEFLGSSPSLADKVMRKKAMREKKDKQSLLDAAIKYAREIESGTGKDGLVSRQNKLLAEEKELLDTVAQALADLISPSGPQHYRTIPRAGSWPTRCSAVKNPT